MPFFRKLFFKQSINPKSVFNVLIFLAVIWILAKPLQGIGFFVYKYLGKTVNNFFNTVTVGTIAAKDFIKSEKTICSQAKIISLLKIKIAHSEEGLKEIEKLRNTLNLKKHIRYKTISSTVIGRSADSWHRQIILDKGLDFGIMIGDSILSSMGIVGQIIEVQKNNSIVQLISDPSYKLGCKIKKRDVLGILSGKTNSLGILKFIPIGTKVKIGDEVVTSGIATGGLLPTYPAGHPVGKIIKVSRKKKKSSDLYIEVKLSEDLNSLSDVLVFSP